MTDQFEFPFNDESEFPVPNARHDDPETSHEAARDAAFHASESRILALKTLAQGPMTDYELEAVSGRQKNSIGKRRLDCQRAGLVEVVLLEDGSKLKRPGPSGSSCLVWKLTPKGEAYVKNL